MQYFRKSYTDIIIFLLGLVMACLSGWVILNNPGMSVSGWIFGLAPVVAIGITITLIKLSAQTGYTISTFFQPSSLYLCKRTFLVVTVLSVILGVFIIINPFDFIMPLFIGMIISLFLLSIYMVVNDKSVGAIGLLLISLPFITYAEFETTRLTGFKSDWITIKIAIILFFTLIWFITTFFVYKKSFVKGKFDALLLTFILITFFSAVFSTDIVYSLKRWLFEINYPILFYFIVINSIRDGKDIKRFMSYLVAGVFLNLILVLYYFAKYGGWDVLGEYVLYLNFADGVLVANTLIMTIPIVIAFLVTTHTKSLKLLLNIMIALGIIGVILSFSRTIEIALVIELLAFLLINKTRKYAMIFGAIIVLIFIFNSEKLDPYIGKYKELVSFKSIVHDPSMEKRFGGWRAALGMFKDHPLTGIGIGRFNQEYANYGVLYFSDWAYKQGYLSGYVPMISAHNIYLNYLGETGIPGILLLITIFSTIIVKGFSLVKKADSNYVFKCSLLISLFGFLLNSLFDGITFAYVKEIDRGLIFWSIAAIIMSYGAVGKNQSRHLQRK